jgi:hypothetical protein
MYCQGALTRQGRPLVQLDWPAAKSRARGGVRGPQPCLRTRGLAMPAQRGRLETRGAARDGASAHKRPLQKRSTARRPASTRDSSHNDSELRSMSGLGAWTRRGAAVLRLDGQHTGR